jgi:hypothetical protein
MTGPEYAPSAPASIPGLILIPSYSAKAAAAHEKALFSESDMEDADRASAVGLGCVRGTMLLFLFEAAAALAIYFVWHLWRLIH